MPSNLIRTDVLRKAVDRLIQTQPIQLQVWSLVAGDGLVTARSYGFSTSYVGAFADTGREVFRDAQGRGSGSAAVKNFVVTIPYIAGRPVPQRNDHIVLYRMDGTQLPRMRVLFIVSRDAGYTNSTTNTVYAHEIHAEIIES